MQTTEEYEIEIYNQTMAVLEERARKSDFDIQTVEAEYEALMVYQGHGMDGRNLYKEAEIESQINAYQVFLHRLRRNKPGN